MIIRLPILAVYLIDPQLGILLEKTLPTLEYLEVFYREDQKIYTRQILFNREIIHQHMNDPNFANAVDMCLRKLKESFDHTDSYVHYFVASKRKVEQYV